MISRRMLLRAVGSAGIVGARGGRASIPAHPNDRRDAALKMRMDAAATQAGESPLPQLSNGDEAALPAWTACFTKGLPTAQTGEVEPGAYESLLRAIESGKHADFETIARGSGRRLVNPQAAYAYCLEGGDPHRFGCAPAPAFASAEMAAEMTEMYWLALARDIPFRDYSTSAITMRAAEELKTSARSIFRGPTAGDLEGPYVSQFLVRPVPSGSTAVEQRYRTPLPGIDFMTTYGEWLQIQSGVPPWREYTWDPTPRVAATASGVVVNQAGTQATMTLTVRPDLGQQFVVAATNSFGASDPFPSAEKTLTIYNLPPGGDADQDGLTNADEVARGTDPLKFDTDGDGFGDGLEVALGSDPLNPASVPNLASGPRESIGRYVSVLNGIPPVPLPTTMSREAISLYVSVLNGIPPVTLPTTMSREAIGLLVSVLNAASSGGIPTESVESPARMRLNKAVAAMISRGVSLTLQDYGPDSDQDGIPDRLEELILTDAGKADTDVDGYPDGLEIVLGSDPLEMLSIPLIQRTPEVFGPPLSIQNNGGKVARLRRDIRGRSQ